MSTVTRSARAVKSVGVALRRHFRVALGTADRLVEQLTRVRKSLFKLANQHWKQPRREVSVPSMLFVVILILTVGMLIVIVAGVIDYYNAGNAEAIVRRVRTAGFPWESIAVLTMIVPATWVTSRAVALNVLPILAFGSAWWVRVCRVGLRLLACLPTLLLGNALLTTLQLSNIDLHRLSLVALVFYATFLVLVLPTVLHVSIDVVTSADTAMLQHALALGFSNNSAIRWVVLPTLARPISTAIALAITRVIVELAVVLPGVDVAQVAKSGVPPSAADLYEIFKSVYSATTIQANALLILLLFMIALFLGSVSYATSTAGHGT